ncbi:hypothetical protein K2173_003179 [Erythroxylum novogranatense]|uniref:RING-type domain-containing protein n=1 Tax=Erythroxylum novogranatense TaxID=1862640 RepID=A0AAV8TA51_9ROSI|nr:hypothetical protein K2173_003179 [Erythroxylum novogranatense]
MLKQGGSLQGALIGAIRGCTTGIGFVPGFGFGAAAGAITAMELMHSLVAANNLLSGVEILYAHLAGKIYMGWLSEFENSYIGHIDSQGDNSCSRGLSQDHIQRLPEFKFHSANNITEHCCLICLEDCTDGDMMRKTPRCGHVFHLCCLDNWLTINGSCPLCRTCVSDYPTL